MDYTVAVYEGLGEGWRLGRMPHLVADYRTRTEFTARVVVSEKTRVAFEISGT